MSFHVPNKYRVRKGQMGSPDSIGQMGCFLVPSPKNVDLVVIASNEYGWEHVSVSVKHRNPNWEEMCLVKNLFWDEEDCVMQLHPPKSQYVNNHPYCLHLWRPIEKEIPMPESILVGVKELNV